MSARTIALDDERCEAVGVAGAKAAFLAAARRSGLPALPGVVVPAELSAGALRHGWEVLRSRGSGGARLAAMRVQVDPGIVGELEDQMPDLGGRVIVRSSSPLEGDGAWAGAFSTFADVGPAELGTAVRGCWASVFSVDALERAEAAGVDPRSLRMAVLVQPQIDADSGGVATVRSDGVVEVIGVVGVPAPLLQGWEPGHRAQVDETGAVTGAAAVEALGERVVRDAARLARDVHAHTGRDRIEWACAEGRIILLQAERSRPRALTERPVRVPADGGGALRGDRPQQVAAALLAFCGPLGEQLVLPWALALPAVPSLPASGEAGDPGAAWAEAQHQARRLAGEVWGDQEVAGVLADLRETETDPAAALALIAERREPSAETTERVLAPLAALADRLVDRGSLRWREELWRATPASLPAALAGGRPHVEQRRQSMLRWQPFLRAVVRANGVALPGVPVVPGAATGPAVFVRNPHALNGTVEGCVLVADRPLPALASLLWEAAGLVVGVDNTAAHLLEVAASVGLPTVVGVDLERATATGGAGVLASVDGYEGSVTVVAGRGGPDEPA